MWPSSQKLASQGSFYLPSPLPPLLRRNQSIRLLKIGLEKWHILNVWELHHNFYKPKREKGRHEHIKVSACCKQSKIILRRNSLEAILSPRIMFALAQRDGSWEISSVEELSRIQCIVYKYSGRVMSGVVSARESGVLKASFSSGYGGT